MPELPDVEVFRSYLQATALGQKVRNVEVRDASLIKGGSGRELARGLAERTLRSASRRGKYLAVDLDNGSALILHFGMTGRLKYFRGSMRDTRHDRLRLVFQSGHSLVYDCPRKLGQVRLVKDLQAFWQAMDLGPDALEGLDSDGFNGLLRGRRGMIKSALMNQSLLCGVGNVYSDEILFQARLHPRRLVREMTEHDLLHLHATMVRVLKQAISLQADPDRMPEDWLTPRREQGTPCPVCQGKVQRIEVGGRGCFLCPSCQGE